MGRDPQRPEVPSVGASSDDELLHALRQAERRALPSEAKMQLLAERLGPMMATNRGPGIVAWRWLGVVGLAGVIAAGALSVRGRLHERQDTPPAGQPQASALPVVERTTASPPQPREQHHDIPAPVISVDSLPLANAPLPPRSASPPRARAPLAEPVCAGEIDLVERADATLRAGNAQGALDFTREHAERCPRGAFVQERERIAIEALAQLGRASEVRARGRAFEQRFPSSPHIWRIRSLAERDPE